MTRSGVLVPAGSATALLAGAVVVTDDVVEGNGLTGIDRPVLDWFVAHRDPVETAVATVITNLGGTLAMAVFATVVALWLAFRRKWRHTAFVLAATGASGALVVAVKTIVGRARPPQSVQLVAESTASFPSGHTLGSTAVILAVAGVLAVGTRSVAVRVATAVAAASAVLLIGLSRLYLGAHWATDVLAGWLLGGAVVAALVAAAAYRTSRAGAAEAVGSSRAALPGPTVIGG